MTTSNKTSTKKDSTIELVRKKKRGSNKKAVRFWFSKCGNYRITWVREFDGVVFDPPHYHAVVLCQSRVGPYWNFAGRRAPYRTLKAATEALEKHQRYWKQAIQISEGERKGRSERFEVLDQRARPGGKLKDNIECNRILGSLPVWVEPNDVLKNYLFPCKNQSDDSDDSPTCVDSPVADTTPPSITSSPDTPESGPAPSVEPTAKSKTRSTSRNTKVALTTSPAQSAKAADSEPKKKSKRSSGKPTKPTTKKSKSTIASTASKGKRSRSSVKRK